MRFRKSMINTAFGTLQQIVIILLAFVNRTAFVRYLGMEYIGYTTLFSSIFTCFSFATTGFSAIDYRLSRAIAREDKEEVSSLVLFYKRGLWLVGILILAVGILLTGATPYLIRNGTELDRGVLFKIYWLQLVTMVLPYVSSAWRQYIRYVQDDYICTNIDSILHVCVIFGQFTVLMLRWGIYAYLCVSLLGNLISNLAFWAIFKRRYPNVILPGTKPLRLRGNGVGREMLDYAGYRLAFTVYQTADAIVISTYCGAVTTAKYGNYDILYQYSKSLLLLKIMEGIQPSYANYFNRETQPQKKKMFYMLDVLAYFLACLLCCGYAVCYQPFMRWWLGEETLLPNAFLALYIAVAYVTFDNYMLTTSRSIYGDFRLDKKWMILSAIVNVVASLVLTPIFGVPGTLVGTLAGQLLISFGHAKVVFLKNPELGAREYVKKHLLRGGFFVLQLLAVCAVCRLIPEGFAGVLAKGAIAVSISVAAAVLFTRKNRDAQELVGFIKGKIMHRGGIGSNS